MPRSVLALCSLLSLGIVYMHTDSEPW